MAEVLVPFVNNLIVLDNEGYRIFAKYYDGKTKADQQALESMLHKKTKTVAAKNEAEVLLMDQDIFVYKSGIECKFYVSGAVEENELILVGVLDAIYDTLSSLLKNQVDKRTMLDNLELILLTIDETLDHGHIMELDGDAVVSRVLMKGSEGAQQSGGSAQPAQTIGDLSISQALGMAKNSFFASLTTSSNSDGY
jgi:hypothetical protein